MEHPLGQLRHAACQRALAVLVPEELGIRQPGAQHPLIAGDDRFAAVGGFRVGDQDETWRQPPSASSSEKYFWCARMAVTSTSGGTSMKRGSMLPSIGTGHSTSPVTSSSNASSARTDRPSDAASFSASPRSGADARRVEYHFGGVELVPVVGEVIDRRTGQVRGSGGRACGTAGECFRVSSQRQLRREWARRRTGRECFEAAAPSGKCRCPSASTWARGRRIARRPELCDHRHRWPPRLLTSAK